MIEELIDTYSDYLYRIAFIYTKDEKVAEEVVQDVFWKYYQTQQYDGRASMKTYLTKMTINRSYDYLRSWKTRKNQFFESFTQAQRATESMILQREERGEITAAVLKLPVKYREVLLLYYYEDMQVKEIAQLLGIVESTVKTRLQRARTKLKENLPQNEWEVLRDA
ncbi:sigma-70 family RNA polymerase sigma factor [Lysinibacillus sp. LZ02]|uniref:sigma-70 family RNA polymerase sigma factor n=1 Tax=Lysinibacillus sp. LZ02 TaxID=3420668 RepID=UPI003D36C013